MELGTMSWFLTRRRWLMGSILVASFHTLNAGSYLVASWEFVRRRQ
jgi:hypothetical protein